MLVCGVWGARHETRTARVLPPVCHHTPLTGPAPGWGTCVLTLMRSGPAVLSPDIYSKGPSHRNRPAAVSQSISKFLREIELTVSQFLNVHGKFSESGVTIAGYLLCSITSGARCLSATVRTVVDCSSFVLV